MNRWMAIAAVVWITACTPKADPNAARSAETAAPTPTSAPASEPTAPPEPATPPVTGTSPAPIPPLSSPNEKPAPSATASAQPEEEGIPHVDPRQTALRRAGESAQACYASAGLPAGTAGKLFVRITLAADGSVASAEVDRSKSAPKLVGGKLEQCVLAAVKKQRFPAPRSGTDVTLDMPLEFRPPN